MTTIIYKLSPKSPFHIGERGVGIEETGEIIHSDTLFSAIASAWRIMGEDVDKLLDPFFANKYPFKLSSAFPYANDVLFFPAPLTRLGDDKKIKKTRFVSMSILFSGSLEHSVSKHGGKMRVSENEKNLVPEKLWEDDTVPRVAIDRMSSSSNIFHCGRIRFAESCGLYFLAEIIDEAYEAHLDRAVDLLGDSGLGGERTTGHGQFSYSREKIDLPAGDDKSYMAISLYHPTKAEVEERILDNASYNLIKRGGWISSPDGSSHRRRSVMMLTEGSLFSKPVDGNVTDVTPTQSWEHHKIYRYGIAFNLPLGWEVEKDG